MEPNFSARLHPAFKVHPGKTYGREEYLKALEWEDDEGEVQVLENVCIPEDFLAFAAAVGTITLELGTQHNHVSLGLVDPSMLNSFLMNDPEFFPTAFLIATTSRGEEYVYMDGQQGVGIYRVPEDRFIALSFTALFVQGEGLGLLLGDE